AQRHPGPVAHAGRGREGKLARRVRRLHCARARQMVGAGQIGEHQGRVSRRRGTGRASMAKITFAAGTSHTPMLLASDETLPRFEETDKNIKHRDKEGRQVTYRHLPDKAGPKLGDMVAPKNLVARQNVAREAAKRLRQAVAAARLDALIVMGDDQNESYLEDCRPAFAIYYGETIRNNATQHKTYAHLPEWYV